MRRTGPTVWRECPGHDVGGIEQGLRRALPRGALVLARDGSPLAVQVAAAVDDLSGGRMILGLGAGWQECEHEHYGFDLLAPPERFARFEEGLQVITRLLGSPEPVTFSGHYYHLKEASLLPKPDRPGGPPILVGGNGPKYTLPLVVKFASEWNAVFKTPDEFASLSSQLDEMLEQAGRHPSEVRRSLMTNCIYASSRFALSEKLKARKNLKTAFELRQSGIIVGSGSELVEQIGELDRAGVQRVMLQWLDLDDMDGLEGIASEVLPHFQT